MVFGIGTDTFDFNRFLKMSKDKKGFESFIRHTYTQRELSLCHENFFENLNLVNNLSSENELKSIPDKDDGLLALACLFCAKESVFKSLNLSPDLAFHWNDIEILPETQEGLKVNLFGLLKDHEEKIGIKSIKVDISIDNNMILSGAICEK